VKKKPIKAVNERRLIQPKGNDLFSRVVSILDQAKGSVVRAVNRNMIIAYWLIGREIVLELQSGEELAEYRQIVHRLEAAQQALKSELMACFGGKA
jgi:hypothetical protein